MYSSTKCKRAKTLNSTTPRLGGVGFFTNTSNYVVVCDDNKTKPERPTLDFASSESKAIQAVVDCMRRELVKWP